MPFALSKKKKRKKRRQVFNYLLPLEREAQANKYFIPYQFFLLLNNVSEIIQHKIESKVLQSTNKSSIFPLFSQLL